MEKKLLTVVVALVIAVLFVSIGLEGKRIVQKKVNQITVSLAKI